MNCPHCQKELPDNAAASCPFCQQPLPAIPESSSPTPGVSKSRYWLIFWLAFVGAPALALLSLTTHIGPELLFLPFVGAVIAGFALAKINSDDTTTIIVTGILYSLGVIIVYVGLLFVGCVVVMAHQ
jgi:hypothetical protein